MLNVYSFLARMLAERIKMEWLFFNYKKGVLFNLNGVDEHPRFILSAEYCGRVNSFFLHSWQGGYVAG
jgi:hypothetical protein